jgi:hypothetical protein
MGKFTQVCIKVRTKLEENVLGILTRKINPFIGLGFRVSGRVKVRVRVPVKCISVHFTTGNGLEFTSVKVANGDRLIK